MVQSSARLLSVDVGLPRDITWQGRTVHTAVWKSPVSGRTRLRRLNLDGDGQGDLAGHGGEHRAVYVYQLGSYRHWETTLGRKDFVPGQFGENFTVEGLADDETCIGDRYRIGTAVLEVTQPRVTCYRVGIRMNEPRMPALLTGSGRPGFYCRVLTEGDVGPGDPIVKIADGPERMTIREINALLYLPGHPRAGLERALRIAALSPGWRTSFAALLESEKQTSAAGGTRAGNAGLAPTGATRAAPPGFVPMRVAQIVRETEDVLSFSLEAAGGGALTEPLPGQFVVLRLRPMAGGPPLFRSYSLSGCPSTERYRISVKVEPHGAAGAFLHAGVREGDLLDVSAPRGAFVLKEGSGPVVFLSAGIGATPLLSMLHALTHVASTRDIWWIYGTRNRESHPFAAETDELLRALPHGRRHVVYSRPSGHEVTGKELDGTGHVTVSSLDALGVPHDAEIYLCGPPLFLTELREGLARWGAAPARIYSETFGGGESMTPGVIGALKREPHRPAGPIPAEDEGPARFIRAQRSRGACRKAVPQLARARRGL